MLLVGNPNVGKSVIFGALTGRYATVSNFPGTTVAVTSGHANMGGEVYEIIDSPGVNTLDGVLSEDEAITKRLLVGGGIDLVIQVADARNLRRGLMLTEQLAASSRPTILVLNMVDEARAKGIDVDADALARVLAVPVIETVAVEGRGLNELRSAFDDAHPLALGMAARQPRAVWAQETAQRLTRRRPSTGHRTQEAIARWVRQPLTAIPLLAAVLYAVYLVVGVFGAQTLVELLEDGLFGTWINPAATALVTRVLPWAAAREFFVGEYGLITMGLTYAIAIVLPVVSTFFLIFGVLEDSGYLPRLAIFSDRLFRTMGLNGRAVLPIVLGLGCDTMATLTTRVLETPKERLIVILLLALGVPCSAQLAVTLALLQPLAPLATAIWAGVVVAVIFTVGRLAARVLPGSRGEFVLELPPLRIPGVANVLRKTLARIEWYLKEAVPLFALGTLLLFLCDRLALLSGLERLAEPLLVGGLALPKETAEAFVVGFLRRDFGAAGLYRLNAAGALSAEQILVAVVTMTLFIPCVANFLMIVRERGWKTGLAVAGFVFPFAFAVGSALAVFLRVVPLPLR